MARRTALLGSLLAGLLLVAGCGRPSGEEAPTGHNNTLSIGRYVALGDSYTAAPGVPSPTGPAVCLRSDHDYPALISRTLGPATFRDVSCSGAATADMHGAQALGVPPQFDALTADTDLVTVGIGGNDLGLFRAVVGRCVQLAARDLSGAPCTEASHRTAPGAVQRVLATIRNDVTSVLRGIEERSPRARIVAVGYPQLVPPQGSCQGLPLAQGDYPFARTINQGLDQAVRSAARTVGVRFADIWAASAGHDICAADPWINGIRNAPGKAIPFHPFEAEQQAVARLVVRAVRHPASPSPAS